MEDGIVKFRSKQSFFNVTAESNKFDFHTGFLDQFFFTKYKDELEEILNLSNIPPERLQDKRVGPRIFKAKSTGNRKQTD